MFDRTKSWRINFDDKLPRGMKFDMKQSIRAAGRSFSNVGAVDQFYGCAG